MNEISSNLMPTTSHYCTLSDAVSTIALVIALCRIFIVGTPPPFPLMKWGAGRTFQKLSHLEEGGGYEIFCWKEEINLKRGG